MSALSVINGNGEEVSKLDLTKTPFAAAYKKELLANAVNTFLANTKSGTKAVKNRGLVTGSTRKIYRQKGTGNARHGDKAAPIFVGGGATFQLRTNFSKALPKKVKKESLRSAVVYRIEQSEVVVLDELKLQEIKTKLLRSLLLKIDAPEALIVLETKDETIQKSASNLPNVKVTPVTSLNVFDVLKYRKVIFSKAAFDILEKNFGAES